MAKHPITNIQSRRHFSDQNVMWEGKLYTGWYGGLGAFRSYKFIQGNIVQTMDLPLPKNMHVKPKHPVIELPFVMEPKSLMTDCPCGDHSCITCMGDDDAAMDAVVLDTIDEIFEDAMTKLPKGKETLKKYSDNPNAEKAIKIIDTLLNSILEIN